MPKNKNGFKWVQITNDQYQKCIEMGEPQDTQSFITGWCIDQMFEIPQSLPRKYKGLSNDDKKKILSILNQEM